MKLSKTKLGAAALVSMALLGGVASAQTATDTMTDDQMETQALMAAKMSIGDAITAAETDTGDRAMSAEFTMETGDDTPVYVVEVVQADGTTTEVAVSTADGSVAAHVEPDDKDGGNDNGDDESEDEGEDNDNG